MERRNVCISRFSLNNSALVNRIARLTAGAVPQTLAKLGREQIIFLSGVHDVSSEWRQV
jgi:hypothetical protein